MKEYKYNFLTSKELKPTGWIKRQLEIQAAGLCGNLDKIWPDVRDSAWIGGNREGWERVPYWLDGFIPMAYFLDDKDLITRAKKYIDAIISSQNDDGWICPCSNEERENYDVWAALLISKVLAMYADFEGDDRIVDVLTKCFKSLDKHTDAFTLRNWGAARWFEGLIGIFWLYEKTHEEWLISLFEKLRVQGFDWSRAIHTKFMEPGREGWDLISHVVNIAMMLKSDALVSLFDDVDPEKIAEDTLGYLRKNHWMATEHFTGDECLSGDSPIRGTELCGVVEAMFSYELLFAVTGNVKWLDSLEKLAFNALPATVSTDMWSHQYDQMTNQVECVPMKNQHFRTNTNDAHIFGLEPNFGCCTANFGQGWPKLFNTSFMQTKDGIASCSLLPADVNVKVNNSDVRIILDTEYPFREKLTYKIITSEPVEFALEIRIPDCVCDAVIDGISVKSGEFYKIKKTWIGYEEVCAEFKFEVNVAEKQNSFVNVWRGPLLYAVDIDSHWEKHEYVKDGVERKFPYCDYYITPKSKWNYGLLNKDFEIIKNNYKEPFGKENPPVQIMANMCSVDWQTENGHCAEHFGEADNGLKPEKVKLIPYGCTDLRIADIPFISN